MKKDRKPYDYFILFTKGMGMGTADVVPGVSGGTIAFISGIYEELIDSISRINFDALKKLKDEGFKSFWNYVNGNFFLALLSGIAVAIVSLAKLITYLLENHPIHIWSFFFGLVFASIYFVAIRVEKWSGKTLIAFFVGAIIAYAITSLPAQPESDALWYIFISGMIAICAMILPGISGSFILLLLGSYTVVLGAIKEKNLAIIIVFSLGAVIGLLSFSRFLKWLFSRYHDLTIALLSGFLLGSLNKIWPWKQTISSYVKHAGEPNEKVIPLEQLNLMPQNYEAATGLDAHLLAALVLGFAGLAVIVGLELLGYKKPAK